MKCSSTADPHSWGGGGSKKIYLCHAEMSHTCDKVYGINQGWYNPFRGLWYK